MVSEDDFDALDRLATHLHEQAVAKGFTGERTLERDLMLIMSEAFECFEDKRHGKDMSEHIEGFTVEEEEFADMLIRILETSRRRGLRIGSATVAKVLFNSSRPHKHGKAF